MSSCLQREAQNLRYRTFSSPNQDAAAQLQDIDDHEEQHAVAPLVRQALHSRVQLRDAWLKGGRAGRFDSSDGEQAALDRKLFTVGSQQRLGGVFAQFGGSSSENRAPEWLEIFPRESRKLPGHLFVALCTGGGMGNQGAVHGNPQEQAGCLPRR